MKQNFGNIYNNNLTYVNNLMKQKEKIKIKFTFLKSMFFIITFLIFLSFVHKKKSEINDDLKNIDFNHLNNLDKNLNYTNTTNNKSLFYVNENSHRKKNVFFTYFIFNKISLNYTHREISKVKFSEMFIYFYEIMKCNFLNDICLDKKFYLEIKKITNFFSIITKINNFYLTEKFKIICFNLLHKNNQPNIKLILNNKEQNYSKKNIFLTKFKILIKKNEIQKKFIKQINRTENLFIKNRIYNISNIFELKILRLILIYCENNLISFELENFYQFFFYKKLNSTARIDSNLKSLEVEKIFSNYKKINLFCFDKKINQIGFEFNQLPKCLEFENTNILDLLDNQNLKFNLEIDYFFYYIKNQNINLLFFKKTSIDKKSFSFYEFISNEIKQFYSKKETFFSFVKKEFNYDKILRNDEVYIYKNPLSKQYNIRICNLSLLNLDMIKKFQNKIWIEFNFLEDIKISKETKIFDLNLCFKKIKYFY